MATGRDERIQEYWHGVPVKNGLELPREGVPGQYVKQDLAPAFTVVQPRLEREKYIDQIAAWHLLFT